MTGAALKRVHRRCQAILKSLAVVWDHKALWIVSTFMALFLHAAIIVPFFEIFVSKNVDIPSTEIHEIFLEFDIVSNETAEAINSLQFNSENTDKKEGISPVETAIIASSETKHPINANTKAIELDVQSDGMGLGSAKATPPREGFHFQDSNIPTQAALDATASDAQAQNAKQTEQRIRNTWEKQLVVHLARYRSYPTEAANQNAQVTLSFVLDRTGHVVSATVARSSGDAAIDEAALTIMQRADPVPAPPASVASKGLNFSLPIVFTLSSLGNKLKRKF